MHRPSLVMLPAKMVAEAAGTPDPGRVAWQAGLVAAALALLDDGYIRIGGMTSRGLGRVKVECRSLEIVTIRDSLRRLWDPSWPATPIPAPLVRRQAPAPTEALRSWRDSLEAWLKEAER